MKLKEYRKLHKLTQQKLSSILGVSRSTIAMWETGNNEPDYAMLVRIAEYFGVSIDELLGYSLTQTVSEKENQPIVNGDELERKRLATMLQDLPVHDVQRVCDFVEGLKAAREEPSSLE